MSVLEQKNQTFLRRATIIGLSVGIVAALVALATLSREEPLPQVIKELPHFSLLDRQGKPYGTPELKGHVWVASFVYTTCPGPCPLIVRKLREIDEILSDLPDFRIVSISVDPQHDTPSVLAEYSEKHGIPAGRWKLLTGEVEVVMDLIRHGFLLTSGDARVLLKDAVSDAEMELILQEEGPVTHSARLVLVDRDGAIRGFYQAGDPVDLDRLTFDARRLNDSH